MAKLREERIVVTIHKKRDHAFCKNYRNVTLLPATYIILTALTQKRCGK